MQFITPTKDDCDFLLIIFKKSSITVNFYLRNQLNP